MNSHVIFILLSLFIQCNAWSCLTHEELVTSKTAFASDILFFKTDEHIVIQQHLAYVSGRPYFNISYCMKNQSQSGFTLKDAGQFDFDKQCQMLGAWMPVYTPDGVDVLSTLFLKFFEEKLTEYVSRFKKRSLWAPLVDSFKATLSDFDNLLLMTAGAAIVRQAYIIAPFANNFGGRVSGKGNMRAMRAGGFLMALSLFGLYSEASSRQTSVKVHQEKLQEVLTVLEQLESELNEQLLNRESQKDYFVESRIFGAIVEAIAFAFVKLEDESGWICSPMKDPNNPLDILRKET